MTEPYMLDVDGQLVGAARRNGEGKAALCSACKVRPQRLTCAYEHRLRRNKQTRKNEPVHCSTGFCDLHQDAASRVGEWRGDIWLCETHRTARQITLG